MSMCLIREYSKCLYESQLFISPKPHSILHICCHHWMPDSADLPQVLYVVQIHLLRDSIGYIYFTLNRNVRDSTYNWVCQVERKCAIHNWSLKPALIFYYFNNNILWTKGPPFGSSWMNVGEVARFTSSPFSYYNYKPLFSPNF